MVAGEEAVGPGFESPVVGEAVAEGNTVPVDVPTGIFTGMARPGEDWFTVRPAGLAHVQADVVLGATGAVQATPAGRAAVSSVVPVGGVKLKPNGPA